MKDLPPATSGETYHQDLKFGDTVRFSETAKPSSVNHDFLVIEVKQSDGIVEVMRLPNDRTEAYGMVGTERIDAIVSVTGSLSTEETMERMARSFMSDGHAEEVDPRMLDIVRSSYQKDSDE